MALWIVYAIVLLHIGCNVCHTIVIVVIWIILDSIPVKQIFSVRNSCWCAILITFSWMTVHSSDCPDI
jgi:hypothetical protein